MSHLANINWEENLYDQLDKPTIAQLERLKDQSAKGNFLRASIEVSPEVVEIFDIEAEAASACYEERI